MFRRVALTGSAELFRSTTQEAIPAEGSKEASKESGLALEDGFPALDRDAHVETYYQYSLTEEQVQTLVDALQKIKYPHTLKNTGRLSMEEFEGLEALRQVLLDGLR